jgi:hypothetical protein
MNKKTKLTRDEPSALYDCLDIESHERSIARICQLGMLEQAAGSIEKAKTFLNAVWIYLERSVIKKA